MQYMMCVYIQYTNNRVCVSIYISIYLNIYRYIRIYIIHLLSNREF